MKKDFLTLSQPFHSKIFTHRASYWKIFDYPTQQEKLNYILFEDYHVGKKDIQIELLPDLIETLCLELPPNEKKLNLIFFGKHTISRTVTYQANHRYLALRFNPLGSVKFHSFDNDTKNKMFSLNKYLDQKLIEELIPLFDLPLDQQAEAVITLLQPTFYYSCPTLIYDFIDYAVSQTTSLKSASEKFNYSARQIRNIFQDTLGVSSKEIIQVLRFWRAINLIEEENLQTTKDLAGKLDFFDDSHFIRTFTKYANVSPTSYIKKKRHALAHS
ncbi:helix-turn-helix domain-containing protein [Enterococcus sp. LJL90]